MRLIDLVASAVLAAVAVLFAASWSDSAFAAPKRVALVVGNSTYQNVPKLPNPSSDARAVAEMFKNAGFDQVDLALDATDMDFKRAIRKLEDNSTDADIVVVFFAGHGFELRGTNYMIPVDARLADERDVPDETIPLDRIVEAVSSAKRLALIIVDACRDNPFVGMRRRTVTRSVERGLARVDPADSTDTLIAFAAKAGSTAEDGDGAHSPLTTALLDNLTTPGLDIRLALGRVRDEVLHITDNRQEPYVYGSLGGGEISLVPAPTQMASLGTSDANVRTDYENVEKVGSSTAWEIFLNRYPSGMYSDLARLQLAKLKQQQFPKQDTPVMPVPAPPLAPAQAEEAQAWDRIKDTSDPQALLDFISHFPTSLHVLEAKKRFNDKAWAEWDKVKDSNDANALRSFIARFPNAEPAATAQSKLDRLQQLARDEDKARAEWDKLKDSSDQNALKAFMVRYPNSPLLHEAQNRLSAIIQLASERAAKAQAEWDKVKDSSDPAALQDFMRRFPGSPLIANAQSSLDKLKALARMQEEKAQAEWSKLQGSSDPTELQAFIARYPNSSVTAKAQARFDAVQLAARKLEEKAQSDWGRLKDTTDQAALQDFMKRYPNSPRVLDAQARVDRLQQLAKGQEEKAAAERVAEQARIEQEWAAIKDSSDPQTLADFIRHHPDSPRAADAKKRADELRQLAKEQDDKARLAWTKLKDTSDQAALQEFIKTYPNSPLAASAQARVEGLQEYARKQEAKARAEWDKLKDSTDQAALQDFIRRYPASALVASAQTRLTALQEFAKEQDAKAQADWDKIKDSSDQAALQSLAAHFPGSLFAVKAQKRFETVVETAQSDLRRVGCFSGEADGKFSAATQTAIRRYRSLRNQPQADPAINDALMTELENQQGRICPVECGAGERLEGGSCVAEKKESKPSPRVTRREEEEDHRRKPERSHSAAAPRPQVRQEVSAAPPPRTSHGGGGGGGAAIGIGF